MFEGMVSHFKDVKEIDYTDEVPRMTWEEAMWNYGNDKPDIRFGMKVEPENRLRFMQVRPISQHLIHGAGFKVFDEAETVLAIAVPGCSEYSRKQTDELTEWVKRPNQIGMKVWFHQMQYRWHLPQQSVDKFYSEEQLAAIAKAAGADPGDLLLILAGAEERTCKAISELRLEMAQRLGPARPVNTNCCGC